MPYRGLTPAVNDTVAGHISLMFTGLPTPIPFAEAGKPAVGVWARVPHYAATMPFPAAAAALLDCVARLSGLVIDTSELHNAGVAAVQQIDALVRNNPDHVEMVRKLEQQIDSEDTMRGATSPTLARDLENLPSGDELAAELEKFLRDQ